MADDRAIHGGYEDTARDTERSLRSQLATAREELEAAQEAELAEVRWHERADHYGARFEEEKARADRLEAALEKIAQKSPDGTGKPQPIWRAEEMVKIAREALIEHGPDDGLAALREWAEAEFGDPPSPDRVTYAQAQEHVLSLLSIQ